MASDESLYEKVAEEIQRGEIRTGLWAKALAEADYDEAKAKARYLKLRVSSLKDEIASENMRERHNARSIQSQEAKRTERDRKRAFDERAGNLSHQESALTDLRQSRLRIQNIFFWSAFALGVIASVGGLLNEKAGLGAILIISLGAGFLCGFVGFGMSIIARWFIPSQRHLSKEEARIKAEKEKLEQEQLSAFGRLTSVIIQAIVVLALSAFLIGQAIEKFGK